MTLTKELSGLFKMHINHGSKPFWCRFDYVLKPLPTVSGVLIATVDEPDPETARWFPHLRNGIEAGLEGLRKKGIDLVEIELVIPKVYSHPVDTTEHGCEYYGRAFIYELAAYDGVTPVAKA